MFIFMYCECDRTGQLGEMGSLGKNDKERFVAILRFQCGSPRLCQLRIVSFWPRWQILICIGCMSGFMGPDKPSSLRTTLSNRPSLLRGGLLEGEWGSPGWRSSQASVRAKTSSLKQRPDFDLVRTSPTVVICETPRATRTTCRSGSSFVRCISIWITVTLSDMSDCLSLLSSHSISCCTEDDDGYGYIIMMIIILFYLWLLAMFCLFMHIIVYRCKHNTWFN
jgi:hypothetical protein